MTAGSSAAGFSPHSRPSVSVIVPVRNEAAPLNAMLAALLAGTYPPDRLEVVVADGSSTDATRVVVDGWAVRNAGVRRVDNPERTTAAGLNAALAAAQGEVIVRLDAHTRPAPDYVERCVAALAATGAAVVGGSLAPRGHGPFGEAAALAMASPFGGGPAAFRHGGRGSVDTVYLGAWRRETLQAVGGFDPQWARNQDYELNIRLRARGGVIWLDPAIRSWTLARGTPIRLARQYFGYGSGRAATVRRHPGSLRGRQILPAAMTAAAAVGLAMAPVSARARRALGLGGALYGALSAVAARARVGAGRPRTTALVAAIFPLMHLAWGLGFWVNMARRAGAGGREPLIPEKHR